MIQVRHTWHRKAQRKLGQAVGGPGRSDSRGKRSKFGGNRAGGVQHAHKKRLGRALVRFVRYGPARMALGLAQGFFQPLTDAFAIGGEPVCVILRQVHRPRADQGLVEHNLVRRVRCGAIQIAAERGVETHPPAERLLPFGRALA